nr:retrovirus-related Pol polyprotein from transposon TNT 1-94 [Tanacetum cinerariifolium]
MLLALREIMQVDRQGLLNATTVKTEDLDTYDFDCDDISNAKAVLMASIFNYGYDVISEVFKEQFDSIKKTRVRTKEHSDSLIDKLNLKSAENEDLKAQIQDKEQANILRRIVKQAKAKQPLDNALDFALQKRLLSHPKTMSRKLGVKCSTSNCGSKPSSNKKNNRISQTQSRNMNNKVEAQPRNVNKKNRVVEPIHNVHVKHALLKANSEPICATCKESMFDGVHDMCLLDFVKNMNSRAKSAKKHKKIYFETYRITSANVVPPKKPTSHSAEPQKPELKVYNRKPQNFKNVGCPDCSLLGNVTISRVYYVKGLGHNLFSVGQCCDADLEVALRKNTCFIRNLEGVDLISGSRDTNLYIISLDDMLKTSLICLLSKASKTKSWLWHRRLSHLNFGTLNKLAKDYLACGIPRIKSQKDHICSTCALGKSKKSSHQPKVEDTNQEKLYLLHMDLCGPMRMASITGKMYILVIVEDYSRFTWVRFLRSKDEAPEAIIKCIKNIQVRLNTTVRNVRTDNGTEFINQTLREFYKNVGISHQTSVARTPQQNGVVERQNQTLEEAARTMLIFSKALLFLWAEAINTACYTQNHSLICLRYNKTPYELMQDKKPNLSFFHVYGTLCYPTNDNDGLGKLDAKPDIGIFVGYAPAKKVFKIYNKRNRKIIKTIHVTFDELTTMASEQFSSGPGLQCMTPATSSSGLVPNIVSQQPFVAAPRAVDLADSPVYTSIDQDALSTSIPSTQDQEHSPIISQGFKESPKTPHFHDDPLLKSLHEDSTSQGSSSNVRSIHTLFESLEEPEFEVADSDMPHDQEENPDNDDEEPKEKGILHWREQRKTFYAYARGLQSRHDVYSGKCILTVTQVDAMKKHGYGYLQEIVVRRAGNDLYRFKEGDFPRLRINDIEDMLLLRVEDLQLGVESYQKKINVTKPETTKSGIRKRDPYTPYQDPQGFIYVDNSGRNLLIRSDELYKFSDGTLTRLRTLLGDITKDIRMEYLQKRR